MTSDSTDTQLARLYEFFKPMPQTKVWSRFKDGRWLEVCVSWEYCPGHILWYASDGVVKMEFAYGA